MATRKPKVKTEDETIQNENPTDLAEQQAAEQAKAAEKERLAKLDAIADRAIVARDHVSEVLVSRSSEALDAWREYGAILNEVRDLIPSRPEFGAFVKLKKLEEFSGIDTSKNERTAAMFLAKLDDATYHELKAANPDVATPRWLQSKYNDQVQEVVESLHDIAADGLIEIQQHPGKRLKGTKNEVWEEMCRSWRDYVEGFDEDVRNALDAKLDQCETYAEAAPYKRALDFLDHVEIPVLAAKLGAYVPKKPSIPFKDLGFEEAAESIASRALQREDAVDLLRRAEQIIADKKAMNTAPATEEGGEPEGEAEAA